MDRGSRYIPCFWCSLMTAASVCPLKMCQSCHREVEKDAMNGPGMLLNGEKYLRRTQTASMKTTEAAAPNGRMFATSSTLRDIMADYRALIVRSRSAHLLNSLASEIDISFNAITKLSSKKGPWHLPNLCQSRGCMVLVQVQALCDPCHWLSD